MVEAPWICYAAPSTGARGALFGRCRQARLQRLAQLVAATGVAAIRVTTRLNSRWSAVSSSPILVKCSQHHIRSTAESLQSCKRSLRSCRFSVCSRRAWMVLACAIRAGRIAWSLLFSVSLARFEHVFVSRSHRLHSIGEQAMLRDTTFAVFGAEPTPPVAAAINRLD